MEKHMLSIISIDTGTDNTKRDSNRAVDKNRYHIVCNNNGTHSFKQVSFNLLWQYLA